MQFEEFEAFVAKMRDFYGQRFIGMANGMAKYWFDSLEYFDADVVDRAFYRWVRQHTGKCPSLDELQEQIEYVREEDRKAKRFNAPTTFADVLKDAAVTQAANPERTEDDATYGQLMALLAERSIEPWQDSKGNMRPKLTQEQRGEQCCLWARKYSASRPQLAEDLWAAAHQFGVSMAVMGTYAYAANGKE